MSLNNLSNLSFLLLLLKKVFGHFNSVKNIPPFFMKIYTKLIGNNNDFFNSSDLRVRTKVEILKEKKTLKKF